jgi:tyrosine-protein phosphatase YwqE
LGLTKGEGVETNKLLPIGSAGKHILVETSYFTPPMRLHETLRKIKSLGYHPILAHPERYMYMEKEEYLELHEEGIKFQLNLASLAGGYGTTVKKRALWLLSNGLYSVAGSDLHCEEAIEFITKSGLSRQNIEEVKRLLQNRI